MNDKRLRALLIVMVILNAILVIMLATEPIPGDMNGDKRLTVTDLAMVHLTVQNGGFNARADVNRDGVVNEKDLCLLRGILAGLKKEDMGCE